MPHQGVSRLVPICYAHLYSSIVSFKEVVIFHDGIPANFAKVKNHTDDYDDSCKRAAMGSNLDSKEQIDNGKQKTGTAEQKST
jgi:hypothetical protein